GLVDSYEVCSREDYLPIAVSIGCRLKRDIRKDEPISYRDVELPKGRLCDRLRQEQTEHFGGSALRVARTG
ncbi:MAG: NAD(P)-dependent oxidoreductase, partial [Gammaproteobacteria bacterium]